MTYINKILLFLSITLVSASCNYLKAEEIIVSTKKERNLITKGNKLYEEGKYKEALKEFQEALEENPSSVVGKYNSGLSQIQIGSNPNDTTSAAKRTLDLGVKNMQQIAALGNRRPDLASKANYNLGNLAYNSQDYQKAIEFYKQSLRLNPEDESARRNLRLAQLKIQDQDQQDQNQDQDQQDQNQNQQDQNQDQDQQDQNQDKDQDQQNDEQQQQPQGINPQTAEQILNAIENKENQTRARVAGQNAEKSRQRNRNKRNW